MSDEETERLARITELKARTAAAAKRIAELEALAGRDDELREAAIEAGLNEALSEAVATHGRLDQKIAVVHAKYANGRIAGSVIVKIADPREWSRYKNTISSAKGIEIDHATEKLWRPNVVYPALADVDRLVAELPFFSTLLGDAIGRLCGIRTEDLTGK